MRSTSRSLLFAALLTGHASGWTSRTIRRHQRRLDDSYSTSRLQAQVGIFYGTSTGNTQTVADLIHQAFGSDVSCEPIDVDTLDKGTLSQVFAEHDALVVGTPTWNTGADTERSGTGWDELYYDKLPALKDILNGKKVAVFGLGDQQSYSENYADASGELFDVFSDLGCKMMGSWSQEGYEHEDSKAIRGDKFCGLLLDMINQEELSEDRVQRWVAQLIDEGILAGETGSSVVASSAALHVEPINGSKEKEVVVDSVAGSSLDKKLTEGSSLLDTTIASHSVGGFTPHTNAVTGATMWTSADGRKSFVTIEKTKTRTQLSP